MVEPIIMEQMTDPEMIAQCEDLRFALATVLNDLEPMPDISLSALTILIAQTIDFLVEHTGADLETLVDKVANSVRVLIADQHAKTRKGH